MCCFTSHLLCFTNTSKSKLQLNKYFSATVFKSISSFGCITLHSNQNDGNNPFGGGSVRADGKINLTTTTNKQNKKRKMMKAAGRRINRPKPYS